MSEGQEWQAEPMEMDDNEQNSRTSLTSELAGLTIQNSRSDWTNIHPNFTLELIQDWQNHNFTSQQARDWINIHSPTDQNQAIQEPEYYAWLRDIKQVDSDWVLNHGSHQALKQEYQTYQQTAQILHQTN